MLGSRRTTSAAFQISIPKQDVWKLLPSLSRFFLKIDLSIEKMANFPVYAQRDDSVEMFHLKAIEMMHNRRSKWLSGTGGLRVLRLCLDAQWCLRGRWERVWRWGRCRRIVCHCFFWIAFKWSTLLYKQQLLQYRHRSKLFISLYQPKLLLILLSCNKDGPLGVHWSGTSLGCLSGIWIGSGLSIAW